MTRRIQAGAALGLLLVTTACGTAATGSGGPVTAQSIRHATTRASLAPVAPPTAVNIAVPDPTAVDPHEVRWQKATAGTGNQLVVLYTATGRPECAKLSRVDVTETDKTVGVKVLLGQLPGAICTGPQPMIAANFQTVVDLKAPLGSRQVE